MIYITESIKIINNNQIQTLYNINYHKLIDFYNMYIQNYLIIINKRIINENFTINFFLLLKYMDQLQILYNKELLKKNDKKVDKKDNKVKKK